MGTPYPRESNRCRRLDDALIEMIAVDLQPPSIIEGFVKFVSILDSRYQLPSRRTIMRRLLIEKYQSIKKNVTAKLKLTTIVSLTTDI